MSLWCIKHWNFFIMLLLELKCLFITTVHKFNFGKQINNVTVTLKKL